MKTMKRAYYRQRALCSFQNCLEPVYEEELCFYHISLKESSQFENQRLMERRNGLGKYRCPEITPYSFIPGSPSSDEEILLARLASIRRLKEKSQNLFK